MISIPILKEMCLVYTSTPMHRCDKLPVSYIIKATKKDPIICDTHHFDFRLDYILLCITLVHAIA
jgi:hypothetical protein